MKEINSVPQVKVSEWVNGSVNMTVRMHSKQHNIIRIITTPTTKQDPQKKDIERRVCPARSC